VKPEAPVSETQETVAIGNTLVKAFQGGQWGLAALLMIMLLIRLGKNTFLKKIPSQYLPWVAALSACAAAILGNLEAKQSWPDAIVGGLVIGWAAVGAHQSMRSLKKNKTAEVASENEADDGDEPEPEADDS
jgi:hypothetical protein